MNNSEDNVKRGVWTPWAQVLCYDCHGNENLPNPKTDEEWARITTPQPLAEGNAVTFCDDCHVDIQVYDSVAYEHELVYALRERGFNAVMAQTGGMMSACSIEPSEALRGAGGPDDISEILVTYDFDGDGLYWMGVYDNDTASVDVEWGNVSFGTQDEVLDWAFKNQEKIAKLEASELERPLGDLVQEAKEKAAEKAAERLDLEKDRKPPEMGR